MYAEGAGELGGAETRLPAPGEPLSEAHCGAVHRLVLRCIHEQRPGGTVEFLSPLRTPLGTSVRGSTLRDRPRELLRLMTWIHPQRRPDLAVVFVDQDGDRKLRQTLVATLDQVTLPWVLVVPAPEYEAWLLADVATASRVLGVELQEPKDPESMAPGEAKRLFLEWSGRSQRTVDKVSTLRTTRRDARIEIFETCRLELLRRQRSFEQFERDLRVQLQALSA